MILLTRKIGQTFILGRQTTITILGLHDNLVRVGIDMPLTETLEFHGEENVEPPLYRSPTDNFYQS